MPEKNPFGSEDGFLRYIQQRRDEHPYYVERLPDQRSEIITNTSGTCYEIAKRMCALTNSHMITDLPPRWKEIEIDRANAGTSEQVWTPFAKALQNAPVNVLTDIPLEAALRLRSENRLEKMRHFFRKVWTNCRESNEFSAENALNLSAELGEKITEAEAEWKKIDQDLLEWIGKTGGPLVMAASASMLPAVSPEIGAAATGMAGVGGVISGTVGLIQSTLKRISFKDQYPAAFFLGLKRK